MWSLPISLELLDRYIILDSFLGFVVTGIVLISFVRKVVNFLFSPNPMWIGQQD